MYSWVLGMLLVLLTLVARADERTADAGNFQFRAASSLFSTDAYPVSTGPDASFYGSSEDSLRLQQARSRQLATFRDNIYNALGISDLIPRGSFMAAGMKTEWHLNTPNRNTVEFRLEARW
jgi:hypothetical protein